jgi:hypothetical protein
MPKTLADGRIKLVALTEAPAVMTAPTVTELAAGVDVSCRILKSDFKLTAAASDTVPDQELCHEGNAVTYGASNYDGSVTPFRYLTDAGKADADNDIAWDTFKEKGTELWLVKRVGPKYDVAFAAADEVEIFHVLTDNPQDPSDLTGYIKKVVPLGVQDAELNGVVAAGS